MKNKKKHGRPLKLNKQIQDEIVKYIEAGNYVETASALAGIHKDTFYRWIKEGARSSKYCKFKRFSDAIKKAESKAEASGVVRVRYAGKQQWQAEAWFLERRFPRRWALKKQREIPIDKNEDNKDISDYDLTKLSLAEVEMLKQLLEKAQ